MASNTGYANDYIEEDEEWDDDDYKKHDTTNDTGEANENGPTLEVNDVEVKDTTNETGESNENGPTLEEHDVEVKDTTNNTGEANENGTTLEVNDVEVKVQDEAKKLRKLLRLYFYSAFKWKGDTCYFHIIYCFVFFMQIIKVALLTILMFYFGNDRRNFSSVVNRGHLVLRHLLLENWDASRETLPYPPAQGEFAVYKIDDLESGINYAVRNYYNAEREAIGYYVRTDEDTMTVSMKYFDFPGFQDTNIEEGITIYDKEFPIDKGLTKEVTNENVTKYKYDIAREFDHQNLSQPIKRMLSTTLHFKLHSVRSHGSIKKATCLRLEGWVQFVDLDNNGQVTVDLETQSSRIKCKDMNISISDLQLENTSEEIGTSVISLTFISLVLTTATMIFATYTFWRTKQFMKKHFRSYFGVVDDEDKQNDLPTSEYFRFLKFWDITVILSDILTLYGTIRIVFTTVQSEWVLEMLDSYTVWLGMGCLLAWISLLKFFKFHNKFHLLFSTLYKAFWDVITYLVCVGVLFVGFWVCGYVVLAPYHVKFKTPAAAAETLLSVVNGDEIYATLAILESDSSGGNWVWWFSRFYIGSYVAVFTIVIINLLIALFNSAYEGIKQYYENKPGERELGPIEKALRRVLTQKEEGSNVCSSIYALMNERRPLTEEENSLRMELSKLKRLVTLKPRTLKSLMEDKDHQCKKFKWGLVNCSFTLFAGDEQTSKDE